VKPPRTAGGAGRDEEQDVQAFDLAVIGGGPGGYVAALRAARHGRRTALIERAAIGGVCLNWGCIPTKALLRSGHLLQEFGTARALGITAGALAADYAVAVRRSRQAVDRLVKGITVLLREAGVTVIAAEGRVARSDADRLRVTLQPTPEATAAPPLEGERELEARTVILATGARPRPLPHLPFDGRRVLSSREALALPEVPRRLLIVGAGAIGLEFADLFRSYGSEVTVVEMLPQVLPGLDAEAAAELRTALARRKVRVRTGMVLASAEACAGGLSCRLAPAAEAAQSPPSRGAASAAAELEVDAVLVAIGVVANSEDLGAAAADLAREGGFLKVDAQCRTALPGLYAIGDLIGPPLLAHAASAEALQAVDHAAGRPRAELDARWVPGVVYTRPPIATAGLTEAEARAQGHDVAVGRFPFRASGRAVAEGETRGWLKVILDRRNETLLGGQIVGPGADELIAELTLIGRCAIPARMVLETVHAHPTLAEAVPEAFAQALGEGLHA
jgi:dihydrolipoamide dehydrogenase